MKKALRALLTLSTVAFAHAAGFQILEQGASNIGSALAGAVTNANNDASAAFWNPSAGFFIEGKGLLDQGINFIVGGLQNQRNKKRTGKEGGERQG